MTYKITNHKDDMDIDAIHSYLFRSYWAKNVSRKVIEKALDNSLCFAILYQNEQGLSEQVGFARMISDFATMAYLADVYILEEHRGKGLSKKLMAEIISHPKLQGLRRILLATSDAHGLYEQFGFKKLANPEIFMELWTPNIYQIS